MLSVLVVNWNTREKLLASLESIRRFPPSLPHEIIVVDNDSSDGSADAVSNLYPEVILVCPGQNTGYAQGNNLAFQKAKGDFLLTLNPDTEFCDHSIDLCLQTLMELPEAGCCAIKLMNFDRSTQRSVRGFPEFLGVMGQVTRLDRLFPLSSLGSYSLPAFDYEKLGVAPQPMGTFLMFRRTALEAIGDPQKPFDEGFPIFFNEVDLLYRLHLAGYDCWYQPKGRVYHHHGASTRQVKKAMVWESHNSLARYWAKHWRGPARLALPLVRAGLFVAAFVRARGYDAGFRPQRDDL